jgi:photosystem II stability/assembly factor-like uncharacterized protein
MSTTRSQLIKLGVAAFAVALIAFVIGATGGGGDSARAESPSVVAAQMVEGEQGWALNGNGLSWTADGGARWTSIEPPGLEAAAIRGVAFHDARDGVIVAVEGSSASSTGPTVSAYRTDDGGATWKVEGLPETPQLVGRVSISYPEAGRVWLLVENSVGAFGASALLYASDDGGAGWRLLPEPPAGGDVGFDSPAEGWIAGGAAGEGLYRTTDGGSSWQQVQVSTPAGVGELGVSYGLPQIAGDGTGVLPVTFDGDFGHSAVGLYATSDAGSSWTPSSLVSLQGSIAPAPDPEEVAFSGPRTVVIQDPATAGLQQVTVPSGPGSTAWSQGEDQSSPLAAQVAATGLPTGVSPVSFPEDEGEPKFGFAVVNSEKCEDKTECTAYHALLVTEDGGRTWNPAAGP